MVFNILTLIGAIVAWTFLWPIAKEASDKGHTLKALFSGGLALVAGFYGISAALAVFAGVLSHIWTILFTIGFLFAMLVVYKLVKDKISKKK